MEHFSDSCGGIIGWLNSANSYTAFAEGWGLYAENPLIAEDTNTYLKEPMQKFGMLQWQVNIYLLLTEFEVRTVRYGPSLFTSTYGPMPIARRVGHRSKEKKRIRNPILT